MSCRGGLAAAWTSLATGSRAAMTPNATTATNIGKWTTSKRRAGCQAMAAAQGRRTRPLEGRAAGPEPPCDDPGAAPTPLCRGAAVRPWRPEGRPVAADAAREESGYASG